MLGPLALRPTASAAALPKLALRTYLAGLGTAAALTVGATVFVSFGLELAFG